MVGTAVEQAVAEEVPPELAEPPPDVEAEVFGDWVLALAPSPGNCAAFCGSMNGDTPVVSDAEPVVDWPYVGIVEVGKVSGSDVETVPDAAGLDEAVAPGEAVSTEAVVEPVAVVFPADPLAAVDD